MIFASKNIRTLYKISDKQYEWLEKIEGVLKVTYLSKSEDGGSHEV